MPDPAGARISCCRRPPLPRRQQAAACLRRAALLALVLGAAGQAGCVAAPSGSLPPLQPPKVAFDLSTIAASGLTGPPGGQVAVDYEFCIADEAQAAAAVRRIDVTARCSRSRGRIGCRSGQLLCIGHTHRPGWRAVLDQLAARDDILRIERHFAE